ncbi:hypothetical protein KC19_VG007300 [Ceratodon purpureus]|uniref:Uncharacterized protein n=1 Tax=Ceratodon purpureus TaxID=3225 RepID=A0A8T0HKP0_CERPU|nr:hypothetical protein KC19_VG007300 [Ceratodon purpureus]
MTQVISSSRLCSYGIPRVAGGASSEDEDEIENLKRTILSSLIRYQMQYTCLQGQRSRTESRERSVNCGTHCSPSELESWPQGRR